MSKPEYKRLRERETMIDDVWDDYYNSLQETPRWTFNQAAVGAVVASIVCVWGPVIGWIVS